MQFTAKWLMGWEQKWIDLYNSGHLLNLWPRINKKIIWPYFKFKIIQSEAHERSEWAERFTKYSINFDSRLGPLFFLDSYLEPHLARKICYNYQSHLLMNSPFEPHFYMIRTAQILLLYFSYFYFYTLTWLGPRRICYNNPTSL